MIDSIFNNSILLINFNYSKDTNNKEFLKKLYQPYFKSIFFYSNLPATQDEEINFVNTQRGSFTHRIFVDFFEKGCNTSLTTKQLIYTIYSNLYNKKYIEKKEIEFLENWLIYF
jgi:hypothetical protein